MLNSLNQLIHSIQAHVFWNHHFAIQSIFTTEFKAPDEFLTTIRLSLF